MEASRPAFAHPTIFACAVSFPTRHSTFPTQFSRNQAKRLMGCSFRFLKLPYWGSFVVQRSAKLLVNSQFRTRSRRRNSLREKLFLREDQVRMFPESSNPESIVDGNDAHALGIDFDTVKEPKVAGDSRKFDASGNSSMWNKLENWVDRYKEDSEFWGIGTGPIFTILQDSHGNAIRVSVNEDEILERNRIRAWYLNENGKDRQLKDANYMISRARLVAKEIEAGTYQVPRNSSIARFVVDDKKSSLVGLFHTYRLERETLIRIFPRIGFIVLCCLCLLGAVRILFVAYNDVEHTMEEEEMLRRKKKLRMKREQLLNGRVEVLQNDEKLPAISGTMPQLDINELMKSIMQARKSSETLALSDSSVHFNVEKHDFDKKAREIRDLVRKVREIENKNYSHLDEQGKLSSIIVDTKFHSGGVENHAHHRAQSAEESVLHDNAANSCSHTGQEKSTVDCMDVIDMSTLGDEMAISIGEFSKGGSLNNFGIFCSDDADTEGQEGSVQKMPVGIHMIDPGALDKVSLSNKLEDRINKVDSCIVSGEQTIKSSSVSYTKEKGKTKIITSVKEAKYYLSSKRIIHVPEQPIHLKGESKILSSCAERSDGHLHRIRKMAEASGFTHGVSGDNNAFCPTQRSLGNIVSDIKFYENDDKVENSFVKTEDIIKKNAGFQNWDSNRHIQKFFKADGATLDDLQMTLNAGNSNLTNVNITPETKNQNEINHHFGNQNYGDPKSQNKIDVSKPLEEESNDVSDSYLVRTGVSGDFEQGTGNAFIDASKVEEALNDPFTGINIPSNSGNSNCQNAFLPKNSAKSWIEENFQQFDSLIKMIGLGFKDNYLLAKEKAQENSFTSADISKLSFWGEDEELEWMKDENLREIVFKVRENELTGNDPFHLMDADDQQAFFKGLERKAEKVNEKVSGLHEWIHSKIENLDYGADGISLDDPLAKIVPRWKGPPLDQDPEFLKKFTNMKNLDYKLKDKQENINKSQNFANSDGAFPHSPLSVKNYSQNGASIEPKTLIESSDGSSRLGEKKWKEHWQHTKKWTQGFLEVYNAETDPEIKSILKDMGKDLDRWITDKEIKASADLMIRISKKKRRFIEKKMNKIKNEVEKYGAQAVVSKYKEYADEKEEDFLWWLDLRFVLCIELYFVEDDAPRIGFYSLEMAEDIELNPSQFHIIAFEDPGDSKNFCHIMQAQMDMLGSGKAFVVARPPKDAFREAKANGFNITLIRKGEIKLNVDQTLEEVEEVMKEVGSKIYYDKIMKERGVDIRTLMKGVIRS